MTTSGPDRAEPPDRGDRVRFLQIEPTTRCNFTCKFCCGRSMDQSNLDFDDFVETLDRFPHVEHIELQGEGEPLLHPRFFEMARLARDRGIKVSTISNGSLFTEVRIAEILDSGIHAILVSIESPEADAFREIRGGELATVESGISALLAARDARGLQRPSVGLAVTVLKRTRKDLPAIAALYDRLEMDGGITVHMLNPMESYKKTYHLTMVDEFMTKAEEALAWATYAKILKSPRYRRSDVDHYYDNIYGTFLSSPSKHAPKHRSFTNVYRSCPWLDQGLFVNRHGVATGCPRVKVYELHGLGHVRDQGTSEIIAQRNAARDQLRGGTVPGGCESCFIAESIADRLAGLLESTPRRADRSTTDASSEPTIAKRGVGYFDADEALVEEVTNACDGQSTTAQIVATLAERWAVPAESARNRVLPVVDELVRTEVLAV